MIEDMLGWVFVMGLACGLLFGAVLTWWLT
jgi:hypothetical protein